MLGLWRTCDTEFIIKLKLGLYLYDEDLGEDGKPHGDHRGLERNYRILRAAAASKKRKIRTDFDFSKILKKNFSSALNVGHLPQIRNKRKLFHPCENTQKIRKNRKSPKFNPVCASSRTSEAADDTACGHVTTRTESYEAPKRRNIDELVTKEHGLAVQLLRRRVLWPRPRSGARAPRRSAAFGDGVRHLMLRRGSRRSG